MKIALVTDSAAGLPDELLHTFGIQVVSYHIRVGEATFRDGIDLTPETFFPLLRRQQEPDVSTGVPSIETFLEVYQRCASWAEGIVSVHIAGAQSATCDTARLAARQSPVPVVVVDTGTTAMGEGFVVLEAARTAQSGAPLDAVARRAQEVARHAGLMALLESVNYAVKGGRLAKAARLLGAFINLQPLVRVAENRVDLIGQVRRRAAGLEKLIDLVQQRVGTQPVHVAVHYAEDEAEGQQVRAELQRRLNCVEAWLTRIPVALGVHAGPGAIGVGYYVEA